MKNSYLYSLIVGFLCISIVIFTFIFGDFNIYLFMLSILTLIVGFKNISISIRQFDKERGKNDERNRFKGSSRDG